MCRKDAECEMIGKTSTRRPSCRSPCPAARSPEPSVPPPAPRCSTFLSRAGRPKPRRGARPPDAVILSSNENPYGPSAAAREAAAKAAANRYPDVLDEEAREAIAKHHGVAVDRVLLGCGSSEILRMADMAFSGPGRRV